PQIVDTVLRALRFNDTLVEVETA
ncbi:MAG: hypothetical protein RL367_390, partial [Pseudomonadota bacterium]